MRRRVRQIKASKWPNAIDRHANRNRATNKTKAKKIGSDGDLALENNANNQRLFSLCHPKKSEDFSQEIARSHCAYITLNSLVTRR